MVLSNLNLLFLRSDRNIMSMLNILRIFMKEGDISKLVLKYTRIFSLREDKLKSAILLLQQLSVEGRVLLKLMAIQLYLFIISEENVMDLFQWVEDL